MACQGTATKPTGISQNITKGQFIDTYSDNTIKTIDTQISEIETTINNYKYTQSNNPMSERGGIRSESTKAKNQRWERYTKDAEGISKLRERQSTLNAQKSNYITEQWRLHSANMVLSKGQLNDKKLTKEQIKTIESIKNDAIKSINIIKAKTR